MTFVTQPYEPFVDDLLTGLTGGVIREEHRFIGSEEPYVLSSPDVIPPSVKVFGQQHEAFTVFSRGVDYVYDSAKEAIVWKEGGQQPDDHTYFYVNYDRQEADRKLTDRNPGSVTSVLAETFARELAVLHKQMEFIYQSAYVDLATGMSLDHVAALLSLDRKGANFASGEVLFKRTSPAPADISIPAGTVVSTNDGQRFETTDKRTLRRGQLSIGAPVRSQVEGQGGLVPAGAIQNINRPIFGVDEVVSERNTLLAAEKESDPAFRRRIKATLERAGKSTLSALRNALIEEIPGINEGNVQVAEDSQIPGKVHVKFALGGKIDQDLVRKIEETIFYARPAGVRVMHNLPTNAPVGAAEGIGPDGLPIGRQDVVARLSQRGALERSESVPEDLLRAMPEGIVNLQVEVLLRLTEPNLGVGEKEQVENNVRARVINYVEGLPMGAEVIYSKLLATILNSDEVADARLLIRAVVPGMAQSTDAFRVNLFTGGRKPIITPHSIFVGLMGEKILVDVLVTLEPKEDPLIGRPNVPVQVPSAVESAVRAGLVDAFSKVDGTLKNDDLRMTLRTTVEGATSLLQLVREHAVVLNAMYEETGRVLNNADVVAVEVHQVLELGNFNVVLKGELDG